MTTPLTTRGLLGRLAALGLGLLALQLVLGSDDLPDEVQLLNDALNAQVPVLFFSDSSNRSHAPGDDDPRAVHELLAARVAQDGSELAIIAVDHAAYHPLIYRDYLLALERQPHRPQAIVFTVNLRSFLPGWAANPAWQFEQLRLTLQHPLLARLWKPLAVFHVIEGQKLSMAEFWATPVQVEGQQVGTIRDLLGLDPEALTTEELPDDDLQRRLTCNYLGTLAPDDERLAALVETAVRCQRLGIRPLFYLTPVDLQTGERLLPGRFARAVAANAATVVSALNAVHATVLNLTELLPSDDFSWQRIPNEHLNQRGKARLADALSPLLAELLLPH